MDQQHAGMGDRGARGTFRVLKWHQTVLRMSAAPLTTLRSEHHRHLHLEDEGTGVWSHRIRDRLSWTVTQSWLKSPGPCLQNKLGSVVFPKP